MATTYSNWVLSENFTFSIDGQLQNGVFKITNIEQDGRITGTLQPTGIMPTFADRFAQAGMPLDTIIPMMGRWA